MAQDDEGVVGIEAEKKMPLLKWQGPKGNGMCRAPNNDCRLDGRKRPPNQRGISVPSVKVLLRIFPHTANDRLRNRLR